jgi:hypothetical protein
VESNSKIYAALAKAQAAITPAGKSGENKFDNYSYTKLEDYLKVAQKPLADNGLSLTASVTRITRFDVRTTSKGGKEYVTEVQLTGTLTHESGESMTYLMYGEGQDRGDKSIYKAITGARKHLIACVLNIPTTDDPETDSHEESGTDTKVTKNTPPIQQQPPTKQPEPQASATDQQINNAQYDELVGLLSTCKINKEPWKAFITKKFKVANTTVLTVAQFEEIKEIIFEQPKIIDPKAEPVPVSE